MNVLSIAKDHLNKERETETETERQRGIERNKNKNAILLNILYKKKKNLFMSMQVSL